MIKGKSVLAVIPGWVVPVTIKTTSGEPQKIPHIGWSGLVPAKSCTDWKGTLLKDNSPDVAAYFVHSFMAVPTDTAHCIAYCVYGGDKIPAMIGRDQIKGCQFHPEKSGEVGLKVLRRFISQ